MGRTRLGFYGGTFDPVHFGHLIVAQDAFEQLRLDRVAFIPAGQNPLKEDAPEAPFADRFAMLQQALERDTRFVILDIENRSGPTPTFDTVRTLRQRHPDADFYWIIGADQLADLPKWHRIDELVRLTSFATATRPGYALEAPNVPGLRLETVRLHDVEVSATEIRERVRQGLPVDFLTRQAVASYITRMNLYRRAPASAPA